ncbi:MAG: AAA family ATPase, partial [Oscillospiraceae bacterium]|nr:AAA family ATPase [Oscillospiraceae bacterium]
MEEQVGYKLKNINAAVKEIKKAVSGKDDIILWILTAMLSGGHVLLEDVPGVGKPTIALAFSKAFGLSYGRVQFTPDVLPSDITGYSIYDRQTGAMRYQEGAVLC